MLAAPAQALRIGEGQRVLEEARLGEAERVVELAEAVLVCARARARPEIGRNGRGSKHPARNLKQHQRVVRKRRPARRAAANALLAALDLWVEPGQWLQLARRHGMSAVSRERGWEWGCGRGG